MSYPVFIVCRDRLTCLLGLIEWLETVDNADEIYLLDQESTWLPLLRFYDTTSYTVIDCGRNLGHRAGWLGGYIRHLAGGRRFIYTDPDLLPVEECPPDAIERMAAVLDRTRAVKAGFSITLDGLAPWIAERSIAWETKYWEKWDSFARAWRAPIDTTFALYNSHGANRFRYSPAYRLPVPYSVKHLPWHTALEDWTDEDRYYTAHADPTISNYTRDVLAEAAP